MSLTDEQVSAFRRDGVLVAQDVLTDDDLAPVIAAYSHWVEERAHALHADGKIVDRAPDAPFETRFARLYTQSREIERGMDVMSARLPALFDFLKNDRLLDAVGRLLGTDELTCNPIQHIRGKVRTPDGAGGFFNTPWHQDIGVTWEEADPTEIVTCWIPLVDATIENGCMEILPGLFERGFLPHVRDNNGDTAISPDALPAHLPIVHGAVRKGGVVFMHRCTPHRSTPNRTDTVRWSLDLRYQPTGQPTGRPFHPEFVARSRRAPETVLRDYATWASRWEEALAKPAPPAHRVR
jgi:ectoine hydroxylase-related dioxygenase (phytanoyl-CoA dioxygenase family)